MLRGGPSFAINNFSWLRKCEDNLSIATKVELSEKIVVEQGET